MEILPGKKIELTQFQNRLIRIEDVEYFEGSLMTLFLNLKDSKLFLSYWAQSFLQKTQLPQYFTFE
jgi:hypothetical protein